MRGGKGWPRRREGGRLPRCPGPKSRSHGREGTVGALGLCQVEGNPVGRSNTDADSVLKCE